MLGLGGFGGRSERGRADINGPPLLLSWTIKTKTALLRLWAREMTPIRVRFDVNFLVFLLCPSPNFTFRKQISQPEPVTFRYLRDPLVSAPFLFINRLSCTFPLLTLRLPIRTRQIQVLCNVCIRLQVCSVQFIFPDQIGGRS